MGTKLKDIVYCEEIDIKDLSNKIIAIDAFNFLYQFLTTIRQPDGTPLMDKKGRITSHLSGLFFRTINLLENGIKPIFVFDGKPPELKKYERERREEIKIESEKKLEEMKEKEEEEELKKYAMRTARLSEEMVEQSKRLVEYLGLPIVQAPSEGEAQAAYLVKKGVAFASASEDYDSLLFGAKLLIRNLSISGRRKLPGKNVYVKVSPEMIELEKTLKNHGITHDQLIVVAMLIGTDFNINGIPGIGPKKALKLVKEYGNNFEALFEHVEWKKYFDYDWKEVFNIFKNMPVTDEFKITFKDINEEKVIDMLVNEFDFSKERIENRLKEYRKSKEKLAQSNLNRWF